MQLTNKTKQNLKKHSFAPFSKEKTIDMGYKNKFIKMYIMYVLEGEKKL